MNRIYAICLIIITVFPGCKKHAENQYDMEELLNAYGNVWNTGILDPLDTLVSQDFELRIAPDFRPIIGIDSLKDEIMGTRRHFQDFTISIKERSSAGINVCLITWEIVAHKKESGDEIKVDGFSVIFHADKKITGEWISYSDLKWVKEFGFQILPPE